MAAFYVLCSWQWHVCQNMRGTHCCSSMAALVTQPCPNVTYMLPILVTSWKIRLQKVSQDFLSMFCWTLRSFLFLLMAAYYSSNQNRDYAVLHCLCSYKKCQSDEIWSPFTSFGPAFDFHLYYAICRLMESFCKLSELCQTFGTVNFSLWTLYLLVGGKERV